VTPRTVDVHIRRLRKAIEKDDSKPKWILTLRGVGYKFDEKAWNSSLVAKIFFSYLTVVALLFLSFYILPIRFCVTSTLAPSAREWSRKRICSPVWSLLIEPE